MQEAAIAYINRGFHGSNYTITPNHIFSSADLTAAAKATLAYLISKPKDWRLRINDLTKALGYGRSKAYKCLHELRLAGYAFMKRGQKKVEWFFFDTPQKNPPSRAESQSVTFQRDENEHIYKEIKKIERNKITTAVAQTEQEPVKKEVVVSEIIEKEPSIPVCAVEKTGPNTPAKTVHETIPGIESGQQLGARKILAQITPEQAALVLIAFKTAIKKQQINNKVGYLRSIVNAVINGTFTEPDRAQLEAMQTAADRVAKSRQRLEEEKKRGRIINNKDYFAMMQAQYGEKAVNIGGSKMMTKLKARLAL